MLANGLGVGCKEEAERSDVDLLRALGYVEEAPESLRDDPARVRVVTYDPHRSQPGYNLYTEQHEAIAVLIDADGRVIRRFRDEGAAVWAGVEILPDGDLIVVGAERSGMFRRDQEPTGRYLLRMRWDGTIRWKRAIDAHHDVEPLPDGRMLTLEMQNRPIPAIDPSIPVRDDRILVLDGDGETLSAQSLYDLLEAGPIPFAFQHVPPRLAQLAELQKNASIPEASEDETDYIDLLHTNSLEIFDQPGLVGRDPIYQPDSLLLTIRNQDRLVVVGLEDSELRWVWGEGELKGPHNAIWLENGNILVFDNGLGRNWSRVVEVNPVTNAIVWEFDTLHRERFYSATRGSAQRLANGNTLITNSEAGQAVEVSSFGVVVWEYWNPYFSMRGRRGLLGSMKRLDRDLIDSLIERFGAEATSTSAERSETTPAAP